MNRCLLRFGSAGFMRPAFLWAFLPALVLALGSPSAGDAQVTSITSTTGTGDLGTTVSQAGNLYNITGGTRPGSGPNLFHSFGDFSLGAGVIGNFLNTPVNGSLPVTSNIISRVTGGNISNIYGTIQTTDFGDANLFLVNPSGIVFGPQGLFDVGGSVSLTTAHYLQFEGTATLFDMLSTPASLGSLSVAPVVAFGFLSPELPAPITVQGSILQVPEGRSLSLVGGDITIQSGTLGDGTIQTANLRAPSGQTNLVSVASPGEVLVPGFQTGPNVEGASFNAMGMVRLEQGAMLDVSGQFDVDGNIIGNGNSGTVFVRGGQLVMDASAIMANTVGTVDGASTAVDIQVSQNVVLTNGAQIVSRSDGPGGGGDITVSATDTVSISGSDTTGTLSGIINPFLGVVTSGVFSTASAGGNGGQIVITAPVITVDNLGTIGTFNNGGGLPNQKGGDVVLNGETISFTNGASILSLTGVNITTGNSEGSGSGGNVTIQGMPGAEHDAAQSVTVSGGQIFSATFGPGRGGDVLITSGAVQLDTGSSIISGAQDGVDAFPGAGGNITLNLNTLTLTDSSSILSSAATFPLEVAFGSGGNVLVQGLKGAGTVAQVIHLSSSSIGSQNSGTAAGGRVTLSSESVELDGASIVFAKTSWTGFGGDIELNVQDLSISAFSSVTSRTELSALDAGAGGKITVQGLGGDGTSAASVFLSGESATIESSSFGTGRLGDIVIDANAVNLTEGASIQAGTQQDSAAEAGNVTIKANTIDISGGSRIASQVFAAKAGKVSINAEQVALDNGRIETSTIGVGRAGDVVMKIGNISLTNGSDINSTSIRTEAVIDFDNGTTIPPGQAGNITINATGAFTSDASSIATSAEANHGGDISITAHSVLLSNGTVITANSKAPLVVTKFVLQGGLPVEVEAVGDDGRSDGNAGNVTVTSASNVVMQNSSVTTEASQASGGSIEIDASDTGMIQLVNSKVSTSVKGVGGGSDGGNISIDPQFVILQNSQLVAQANAGAGGAINVIAGVFIADPNSLVSASSQSGPQGTVNIQSPVQNVGGELAALSQEFSSVGALLAQQCAARAADGKFSTFVIAAREGLPAEPGGFLASPSLTSELLGTRHSGGQTSHNQLSPFTGLFPQYDARPIQLAKFGDSCHW